MKHLTALLVTTAMFVGCSFNHSAAASAAKYTTAGNPVPNQYCYPQAINAATLFALHDHSGAQLSFQELYSSASGLDIYVVSFRVPGVSAVNSYEVKTTSLPECKTVFVKSAAMPSECTPDINPWGYPSACNCKTDQAYVPQIGACIDTGNGASPIQAVPGWGIDGTYYSCVPYTGPALPCPMAIPGGPEDVFEQKCTENGLKLISCAEYSGCFPACSGNLGD